MKVSIPPTGSSGIGKTTLLNSIFLGLVKFNTGQIHLTFKNGKPLYSKLVYYQSQQQILVNKQSGIIYHIRIRYQTKS